MSVPFCEYQGWVKNSILWDTKRVTGCAFGFAVVCFLFSLVVIYIFFIHWDEENESRFISYVCLVEDKYHFFLMVFFCTCERTFAWLRGEIGLRLVLIKTQAFWAMFFVYVALSYGRIVIKWVSRVRCAL